MRIYRTCNVYIFTVRRLLIIFSADEKRLFNVYSRRNDDRKTVKRLSFDERRQKEIRTWPQTINAMGPKFKCRKFYAVARLAFLDRQETFHVRHCARAKLQREPFEAHTLRCVGDARNADTPLKSAICHSNHLDLYCAHDGYFIITIAGALNEYLSSPSLFFAYFPRERSFSMIH